MNRKRIVGVALLAMALGACGHGSSLSRASDMRQLSSTNYRSLFLAASTSEVQAVAPGGQVIVEHVDCDPWSGTQKPLCSVESLLEGSLP